MSSNTIGSVALSLDELSEQFLTVPTPPCTELFRSDYTNTNEDHEDDNYQLQPLFQLLLKIGIVPSTTIQSTIVGGSLTTTTPLLLSTTNNDTTTPMNNLQKLYRLVQNRSWVEVHILAEQLLHGSSIQHGSPTNTLHLAPIFTSLLLLSYQQQQRDNTDDNNNNSSSSSDGGANELSIVLLDSHKIELVFVMMVHICAMIKLRYYTKLQNDIETWTFCFHHHHHSNNNKNSRKRLEWIPWSLHIMAASSLFYTNNNNSDKNDSTTTDSSRLNMDTNKNPIPLNAIDELWKIRSAILTECRSSPTTVTSTSTTTNTNNNNISLSTSIALVQVENALANLFILAKEWRMALQCYERMMDWTETTGSKSINSSSSSSSSSSTNGFLKILCFEEVRRCHVRTRTTTAASSLSSSTTTSTGSLTSSTTTSSSSSPEDVVQLIQTACRFELYSRQGRILLQAGTIPEAECIYNQAKKVWENEIIRLFNNKNTNTTAEQQHHQQQQYWYRHQFVSIQIVSIQLYINYGLLEFSKTNFDRAMYYFQKAIEMIRLIRSHNGSSVTSSSTSCSSMFSDAWIEDSITKVPLPLLVLLSSSNNTIVGTNEVSSASTTGDGMSPPSIISSHNSSNTSSTHNNEWIHTLYSETMNNISLCYLYTCRLRDSIHCMECLVREHPLYYCTERIVLNLCTLYELKYDTYQSTICKKIIHYLCTTKYQLVDIGTECYRIT